MSMTAPTLLDRISGQARYASDLIPEAAVVAGMARSPHPHARVNRIDASASLKIPGVLAVLTAADFDDVRLGHQRADEPVLTSVARYAGDGVAAVAATDANALVRGIEALKIDYTLLPHATTMDEALDVKTPIHESCTDNIASHFTAERGDWDAAATNVAIWVEGTFESEAVPHAYLEPRATLVRHAGNCLELVTGSHFPAVMAEQYRPIVESWGVDLKIVTPAIGGSFGAKWEHPSHLVCLLLAHRLNRDVGMVFTRREDMIAGRTRLAMRVRMRLGASADGELLVKETTILADNGAYSAHGPTVTSAAAIRMDNLYRYSAIRADAQLVYSNNLPSECFRGFGSPQSAFAQEQLVDQLARRLDMDPVELRRANSVKPGATTIHGWQIGSCGIDDCLETISKRLGEHRRDVRPPLRPRYRTGYGIAACVHGISNRGYDRRFDKAEVTLAVEADGRIRIGCGDVEIGCGTVDVLTVIVARELAIDSDRLRVVLGDTATVPYGLGSFASRTTFFDGQAAIDACRRFIAARNDLALQLGAGGETTTADMIDLALARGRSQELSVTGAFEPAGVSVPDESGFGNISPAYTFGAHGCYVRVDLLTGKVVVEQYWAAHDAGEILNPSGAVGQVVGGVMQGLGFALAEVVAVDADGQMRNPGYLDDRVATFPDRVPVDVEFAPVYESAGPAGAKTIAEPPIIPVAACVANAIRDAIGIRQYRLPMTPERVWQTIMNPADHG
ncbi:MAG: xanthine dehydrogenase family protein molybdopterin-binding subunit [Woeseiaceae bacterium]